MARGGSPDTGGNRPEPSENPEGGTGIMEEWGGGGGGGGSSGGGGGGCGGRRGSGGSRLPWTALLTESVSWSTLIAGNESPITDGTTGSTACQTFHLEKKEKKKKKWQKNEDLSRLDSGHNKSESNYKLNRADDVILLRLKTGDNRFMNMRTTHPVTWLALTVTVQAELKSESNEQDTCPPPVVIIRCLLFHNLGYHCISMGINLSSEKEEFKIKKKNQSAAYDCMSMTDE